MHNIHPAWRNDVKKNKMKYVLSFFLLVCMLTVLAACKGNNQENLNKNGQEQQGDPPQTSAPQTDLSAEGDAPSSAPVAVAPMPEDNFGTFYEIFVYSFCDSDGDGIGDINGLIEKLDYLNDGNPATAEDLGVNGIWLMPVTQAGTYHKYDVEDYYNIDTEYGTNEDFERLLEECHRRGMKVIIDLVVNHSSGRNPWFLSAKKSIAVEPCGSETCTVEGLCREHNPYCDYYNFTQTKESGVYYPAAQGWYYEAQFDSNMPDLNFDSEAVRAEIESIIDFWMDMGVDGFRLDAALHFYEGQPSKNTEVLKFITDCTKERNPDAYLVAEVWTSLGEFADYYESGIDSIFNFEFAQQSGIIAKTIASKSSTGRKLLEYAQQMNNLFLQKNANAIDAPFLGNHDTGRISGVMTSKPERIKMAAGVLLTLNGNAFVYYGDEIGMRGSGIDENKRLPMLWSTTDTAGMTRGPVNAEQIESKFGSVEEQQTDETSILNYYREAIRLRNENPELARGAMQVLDGVGDDDIVAVAKTYEGKTVVIIYNFNREETKSLTLDGEYKSMQPSGCLAANGGEALYENGTATLPPYSILIIR